jgi:hypothetical protein
VEICSKYTLHPHDNDGELECKHLSDGNGVNRDEAVKIIEDFCRTHAGFGVGPEQIPRQIAYRQYLGDSSVLISVRYGTCDRGSADLYHIDERACNRFLKSAIDHCDTDQGRPYGKYGGTVVDGCGIWKFETAKAETLACEASPYSTPHQFSASDSNDIERAISHYCGKSDLTLDPAYVEDNSFHQFQPQGQSYDNFLDGLNGYVIRMEAKFSADQQRCDPQKKKISTGGDECTRKLRDN